MSEQVRAIVEAVRRLGAEERRELADAMATIDVAPADSRDRRELVESIRGKYRHVPTSSESFIDRKKQEVELESQT